MRVNDVKMSLLVLAILIVFSFAFLAMAEDSGVAGDGIFTSKTSTTSSDNMTQNMVQKIIDASSDGSSDDTGISSDQLQSIVDAAIGQGSNDDSVATVDPSTIKIKKQNYSNLSSKKAKAMEKEDFIKYIASLYYIFASNSPKPITSSSDINKAITSTTESIAYAISQENPQSLRDLSASGEKIEEQLKDLEVPEKLVDLHIKAINYAENAKNLQKYISPETDDPVKKIVNLGKLQGFVESLMSFSDDIDSRMSEYGVDYNDQEIKDKLSKLGLPDLSDTSSSSTTSSSETDNTTSD